MRNGTTATPAKRGRGRPPSVNHSKPGRMSARAFKAWQVTLGLSDSQIARLLSTAPSTIGRYRERGGSHMLALACSAVAYGLEGWRKPE